jgi:hypothetical protein
MQEESKKTFKLKQLSPWNPFDHLRLVWWVLAAPQRLVAYRKTFGEHAERSVSAWLIGTVVVLPPFLPTLAIGLEHLPSPSENLSSSLYLYGSAVFILSWILVGWLGKRVNRSTPSALSAISGYYTTKLVVSVIVSRLAGSIVGLGMAIVAMAVDYILAKGIENSLETCTSSKLTCGAFAALLLIYVFLIWFSFLGGWRVLV